MKVQCISLLGMLLRVKMGPPKEYVEVISHGTGQYDLI